MNNEPDPSLRLENYFPTTQVIPQVISTPSPPNPYYKMWNDSIMEQEVLNQAVETLAAYTRQHLQKVT